MDGAQECPVCTLYLREGISLKQHLETHPKEQVIEALLRYKYATEIQNTVATIPPPPLQPAPQLTTAVTYQQILTSNAAGAMVPQLMQVPAFVNTGFTMGQNLNFSNYFNPVMNSYNSYMPSQYVFSSSNDNGTDNAFDNNRDNQEESRIVSSCEMELSNSSSPIESSPPPMQSVIISRPASSYSSSQPQTPSWPSSLTPSPSDNLSSGSCKVEDTVIVQTAHASQQNLEETEVCKGERTRTDECISNYEHHSESAVDYVADEQIKDLNNKSSEQNSYNDTVASFESSNSPVYADLVPAQHSTTHTLLQNLTGNIAPGTSSAFLDVENLPVFLNQSVLASTVRTPSPSKSCSVIQMADSTKLEKQEEKYIEDIIETKDMPLNILAEESMPARGELSEQESLGADSAWGIFHQDVKEWVKSCKCSSCDMSFTCPKERRIHRNEMHPKTGTEDAAKPLQLEVKPNIMFNQLDKPAKNIRCNLCSATFSTLRERREHMNTHSTLKTEVVEEITSTVKHCSECGMAMATLRALRIHLREIHGQVRFRCDLCLMGFDDEPEFNDHLKIHPLKCSQCDKTFTRRTNLNLHKKRHLAVKPFECALCPKSFITRQKLEEHCNGHAGIKPIKCEQCSRTFSRHSNLIQHRNVHHLKVKKELRDFVCRCGEVFYSKSKLNWHREIHENKPKSCPYCSQKFIHAASVTRHVRRAHMPHYLPNGECRDIENVSCPVCDKICLRSSLSVHMRIHSSERPFQCAICSKQFTTKWNMELHQWTHQSRAQMPYKCTMCKSAFFREVDYMAHLNAHKNLKPFICNMCGQKFIRKYNCLRHQEEHRKAKKFVCTVSACGKAFHRSYYLKDHMKIHTGVRPHTCHICGKASATKSNHNKHLRIHDTREPINSEN